MMLLATWSCESGVPSKEYFTMERKFARYFHLMAQDLIPDDGYRAQLFGALSSYQSSQDVHRLLSDLRQVLDVPEKLELYEYIRPLVLLQHQMEYSYRAPSAPGVRLRTIRLRHLPGQSIGFALRGGFEFGVGMFVSVVEAGSQAELRGLRAGDELVRVNGFVIAEAIHEDVLNLIKSREEIVLKVTHIGMIPIKEKATDPVTWRYADDLDSKPPLEEVLKNTTRRKGRPLELKIFVDASGYSSIGCGILSGPRNFPGIFVEKVRPGSLAHEAGLDVGDQIVEVNDTNFLNISHNEAVMVLKSSKQLNLIIRKKVGMVLFENRQKQSPSHSLNSTQSGQSQPVMQSRLPSSYTSPSKNLDESSLIEDQLRRGLDGLGKATSISASQQNGIETETTSFSYTKVSSDTGHTNGTIPADELSSPKPTAHPSPPSGSNVMHSAYSDTQSSTSYDNHPSLSLSESALESPNLPDDLEEAGSIILPNYPAATLALSQAEENPNPYPVSSPSTPSSNKSMTSQTSSSSDTKRTLPMFRAPPPPPFPPPPVDEAAKSESLPPSLCGNGDPSKWSIQEFTEHTKEESGRALSDSEEQNGLAENGELQISEDDLDLLPLPPPSLLVDDDDEDDNNKLEQRSFFRDKESMTNGGSSNIVKQADTYTNYFNGVEPQLSHHENELDIYAKPLKKVPPKCNSGEGQSSLYLSPTQSSPPNPIETHATGLGGAAAVLAARREKSGLQTPQLLGPEFTSSDIDGKELRSFEFPKGQDLKIAMEGGNGTPLAGKIVVSAVFDGGAAIENGLQTGDQLLMVNGKKLTDVTLAEAEKILEEAKMGSQKMVRVVYAQSLFLNNEECVTYF
ncbi:harmonin-like isoform X4 [Pomacea canaliculata]|uniref:harmonin-like isoform X4 n=1 Tax=Pomacea canaliculata TaxID=400727 RepID=UPI000D73867E|nr:harmonin-like isoform X4 [Pomacea canaliculata]